LANIFPDWLPASNPVDLFPAFAAQGALVAYQRAFEAVVKDPQVDVIFMHYFAGLYRNYEKLRYYKETADKAGKSILLWAIGRRDSLRDFKKEAQECGIPVFGELYRATECLAAAAYYSPHKKAAMIAVASSNPSKKAKLIIEECRTQKVWDEFDSKRLLASCRIPVVDEQIVASKTGAIRVAKKMDYPVVVKGLVPGRVHKTESGLVRLGIPSAKALETVFEDLLARMKGQGRILLQRQLSIDYELIAGFMRDLQFGPCVMFGLGGIFSELQHDVAFAPAPLTPALAIELLHQIKGKKLLQGFRGMKPLNEKAMADILVKLGNLGAACPDIEQIDINPLVVSKGQPIAVDATVIIR
jgi:acetyltransferase